MAIRIHGKMCRQRDKPKAEIPVRTGSHTNAGRYSPALLRNVHQLVATHSKDERNHKEVKQIPAQPIQNIAGFIAEKLSLKSCRSQLTSWNMRQTGTEAALFDSLHMQPQTARPG